MKGAKGGKRDRIISALFSKKNQELKNEIEEKESIEDYEKIEKKEKEKNLIQDDLIEIKETALKEKKENIEILEVKEIENKEEQEEKQDNIELLEVIEVQKKEEQEEKKDNIEILETILEEKEQPINIDSNNNSINNEIDNKNQIDEQIIDEIVLESKENIDENEFENTEEINLIQLNSNDIEIKEPETLLDFAVIDEIEKLIKEDYYELQSIEYGIKAIVNKEDKEVTIEETKKLKEELDQLIAKFERLKAKYDYIYTSINYDQVSDIQNNQIEGIILEYKDSLKNNKEVDKFIKEINSIENYINLINTLVIVDKDKDVLNDKLEDKIDKFEIRDKDFDNLKEKYADIDKINNYVESFYNNQDRIIKDINYKLENSVNITNEIERSIQYIPHFDRLLQATILLAQSKTIPPTPVGKVLKATMIAESINLMANFIERKEETKNVTKVSYQDYSKDINYAMDSLDKTINTVGNAIYNIKDIKENFRKEFSEYANQIPEYANMMKNLDALEKDLNYKNNELIKYNDKYKNLQYANSIKIKKLEYLE